MAVVARDLFDHAHDPTVVAVALEVPAVGAADALDLGQLGRGVGLVVGPGRGQQGLLGVGHLAEGLLLRIEVVVEGPVRQPGPVGDVGDPGLEEPGLLEHRLGSLDQALAGCDTLAGARCRRRLLGRGLTTGRGGSSSRPRAAAWVHRTRPRFRHGATRSSLRRSSAVIPRSSSPLPGRHTTPSTCQRSRRSRVLSTFMLASFGSSGVHPHEGGDPLGTEVRLPAQELVERRRVERGAVPQLERGHHAVADRIVGHRVHGHGPHVGVPGDDRLDRRGGEVLPVDAEPLVGAPREVQPSVGIAVGQVTRPVGAVAEPLLRGGVVGVVALERRRRLRSRRSRRPPPRG